ncbi:TlpA disulfide reductase family protein [Cecembia rubra]|uniref:Peroxiredoxin n=1 Tax=Cecembia rubra TaxID=1485585 RepID=A0A2P8EEZ2_9BACT|nr:TlpA disulfide reductase family protein [Cecembia rubra]PSL08020.1 peroxiredoxin [Cecembia rubra]
MKNLSRLLLLFSFSILILSCGGIGKKEFDGQVVISGKLSNMPEGKIVLSSINDEMSATIAEISPAANGKFEYKLTLEGPGFYMINLMDKKEVRLALYAEDVELNYDFSNEKSLELKGSQDSQYMQQIEAIMNEYQENINNLNNEYFEAMSARDQDKIRDIQVRAMGLESDLGEKVKELISNMDGSFAALAALPMINPKKDFQFMDELISKMNQKYPGFKTVQNLMVQLDEMRALSVGQVAPEISLPDPSGNVVNLSDLRGKYVLIDFWAAWCRPCREENPNVVRLYNQYKDKGFEVFGVSLDRTHEAWIKAIEDDKLTWTHVSDLKYFNSEAAATYQINAIPATYMLDPEGKIIAKDLRGPSLESKLRELFD